LIDETLRTYQARPPSGIANTRAGPNEDLLAFLDRLVEAAPPAASVVEVGSGPVWLTLCTQPHPHAETRTKSPRRDD
jgi:hypothetical protein